MVRQPCPDQKWSLKKCITTLSVVILTFFALPSFATDSTHHFDVDRPDQILAGQEVKFEISARQEDGSLDNNAAHKLLIQFIQIEKMEHTCVLDNGKGTVIQSFSVPGPWLLYIKDTMNPNLTASTSFSVQRNKVIGSRQGVKK